MKTKITFTKAILIAVGFIIFWALIPIFLSNKSIEDAFWYKLGGLILMFVPVVIVLISVKDDLKIAAKIFGMFSSASADLKDSRHATAEILALNENSQGGVMTVNDQPIANLRLKIFDGDKPPYEVSVDTAVPRLLVPRLMPGVRIPIFIDPKNDKKITVDFENI